MHAQEISFNNEREIFQAYMPFLKNGGLFIATVEPYELGDEITLEVTLPDSLESSQVKGVICWQTPIGAQNGTPCGIGISFVEDPDNLKSQIEKNIGRLLSSSDPTFTM